MVGGKRAEEEGWRKTSTGEGGGQLVICRCIVCGQDLTVYNPIILRRRWVCSFGDSESTLVVSNFPPDSSSGCVNVPLFKFSRLYVR